MTSPASTVDQNILPIQAYFNVDGSFNTFIGQGKPFVISATESIGIINVTNNATYYPVLSPVNTGSVTSLDVNSVSFSYNPGTGVLTAPTFSGSLSGTASTATNLAGGVANSVPYQTSAGTTSFLGQGTNGQAIIWNSGPTWGTASAATTIVDDTTTNATRYLTFTSATTGTITTENTSSTKLQFNPSTGTLSSSVFSGAGTGLTGTASSLIVGIATNLQNGSAYSIPYQSGANTTTFLSPSSTVGAVLTSGGASAIPVWNTNLITDASGITIGAFASKTTSISSASTITPVTTVGQYEVSALSVSANIAAPTGEAVDGFKLIIRIKDSGTTQSLTWATNSGAYRAQGVVLPKSTILNQPIYIGCIYNAQDNYWDVVAVS